MKSIVLAACIASGAVRAISAIAGTNGEVGTFVIDSAVTIKIKTNLAAKHLSTLTQVGVDTDKDGVVWLSGTAPSKDARDLAEAITKNTAGVTAVHNHILVE